MGQRSDARRKMVQAAQQLIREGGYGATAFSEGVAQESAELSETSRRACSEMTDRLVVHFVAFGVDRAAARS